ncbi:MAG: orotidine 5'-phosphate decarboxylase, partial [Candidatus Omnitrophica bacterium]|nr:orotidine 5'-phosphate decarboxylase [Candidatus Omnitrophota bacterium]
SALKEIGVQGNVEDKVLEYSEMARNNGMDGVVASAKELSLLRKKMGKDFIVVTPGIRPLWSAANDQKRIVTPKDAIKNGATYIVVGRPIIGDKDPLEAAKRVLDEMEEA